MCTACSLGGGSAAYQADLARSRTKCRAQQAHLDDVLQAGHTVHDHVALHWHAARKAAGQTWKMDCRMGTIERPSRLMAARMSCGVTCTACMQVHTPSQ